MIRTPVSLAVALAAASLTLPAAAGGTPVQVTVTGKVEYNQISAPPLGNPVQDDPATLTFVVYSDWYVDSTSFPTRGYVIDKSTFQLTMGSTTIGLQSPFPAGSTPYFVIRDNDPAVDGFFVSTSVDFPIGVPLAQTGAFGQFKQDYSVTYGGSLLPSLDILDALGTYDYTGLSVFNWTVDDGPFNPLGLVFATMKIEALPTGPTVYCTSKPSSLGCIPTIQGPSATASLSAGSSSYNVRVGPVPGGPGNPGILIYTTGGALATPIQNAYGFLCISPGAGFFRVLPPVLAGGSTGLCDGQYQWDWGFYLANQTQDPNLVAGAHVDMQGWYRDPPNPGTANFSNAMSFVVVP